MFVLSVERSYLTLPSIPIKLSPRCLGTRLGWGRGWLRAVFCVTEEVLSAALAALRHLDPRAGEANSSDSLSKKDLAPLKFYRSSLRGAHAKYRSQVPSVIKNNLNRD